MALPTTEVGLQLLLCPLSSNVLVRTACCSIGTVIPAYSTFKAIESGDQALQKRCLLYWTVYGSFSVAEIFADKIISWLPLYYHVKFAFLVWLQLPSTDGAKQLYMDHLRPFLLKHQARLDQITNLLYGEMNKFVITHQGEFQMAKSIFLRIVTSVNQVIKDFTQPGQRRTNGTFEGSPRRLQDRRPDSEAE